MKFFVTGAAGFIGFHLSESLLRQGHEVIGIDNMDPFYASAIKYGNIEALSQNQNFHFVEGDIRDSVLLEGIFQKWNFDTVIHLAAKAGVRPSILSPAEYTDVNVNGLALVLTHAQQNGVKRFIFASSSSVYGNQAKVPFQETDDVSFPISPYAATKRAGELLCHTFHHLYGMEVACLRFFTVYGPGQRPDLAIHKFTELALQDKAIPIYGDGSSYRDYTYIDDIVNGVLSVIAMPNLKYEIFNLGNGRPVKLIDMVYVLEKTLTKKIKRDFLPFQQGDTGHTHADISKLKTHTGFTPHVSFDDGISNFIEWYLTHRNKYL